MWVAFANAKATHIFFSKNISIYAVFNDQSFSDTLTNDIVSFEQQLLIVVVFFLGTSIYYQLYLQFLTITVKVYLLLFSSAELVYS